MIARLGGIIKDLSREEGIRALESGEELEVFKFDFARMFVKKGEENQEEEFSFQCSSEDVDRHGDIVMQNFILDAFDPKSKAYNPVFLWQHNRNLGPIGRIEEFTSEKPLVARVTPLPKGIDPNADMQWAKVRLGFLKMVSVSFIPREWEYIYSGDGKNRTITGYRYTKNELLEVSLVTIPANPFAGRKELAVRANEVIEPFGKGFDMFLTGQGQERE